MGKTRRGKRLMNPTDAYRKEQRKKELKRNKKERKRNREIATISKDPAALQAEISKLKHLSMLNNLDGKQRRRLQDLVLTQVAQARRQSQQQAQDDRDGKKQSALGKRTVEIPAVPFPSQNQGPLLESHLPAPTSAAPASPKQEPLVPYAQGGGLVPYYANQMPPPFASLPPPPPAPNGLLGAPPPSMMFHRPPPQAAVVSAPPTGGAAAPSGGAPPPPPRPPAMMQPPLGPPGAFPPPPPPRPMAPTRPADRDPLPPGVLPPPPPPRPAPAAGPTAGLVPPPPPPRPHSMSAMGIAPPPPPPRPIPQMISSQPPPVAGPPPPPPRPRPVPVAAKPPNVRQAPAKKLPKLDRDLTMLVPTSLRVRRRPQLKRGRALRPMSTAARAQKLLQRKQRRISAAPGQASAKRVSTAPAASVADDYDSFMAEMQGLGAI